MFIFTIVMAVTISVCANFAARKIKDNENITVQEVYLYIIISFIPVFGFGWGLGQLI